MAITASFTSDWSGFVKGTQEAEEALDRFEKETEEAGGAIMSMVGKAEDAAPKLEDVGKAGDSVDIALKKMGISVPKTVKDMDDLGMSAAESVKQLGAVATAMLAFQAFEKGWQVGRKIAEALGTDEMIGNAVSRWLGWGDVAKETAGAVADEIALANSRVDYHITRIEEARRVNEEWRKGTIQAGKDNAKAKAEEDKAWDDMQASIARVNIALQDHDAVLATMNPKLVEAAKNALAHGAAQKDVAAALLLTPSQIAAVVDKIKDEAEALEQLKKKNEEVAAAMKQHWDGVGGVLDTVFGVDKLQKATTWVDAIQAMGGSVEKLWKDDLVNLRDAMVGGINALARSGELTSAQTQEFVRLADAANQALNALKPVVTVTEDLVKAQWDYVTALDEEARAQHAVATAAKQANDEKGKWSAGSSGTAGLPPNAIVGRNGVALDMFGRPVVAGGGISQLPIVNISVDGNIIGTEAELARLIGNAVTGNYSKGGKRLPV